MKATLHVGSRAVDEYIVEAHAYATVDGAPAERSVIAQATHTLDLSDAGTIGRTMPDRLEEFRATRYERTERAALRRLSRRLTDAGIEVTA